LMFCCFSPALSALKSGPQSASFIEVANPRRLGRPHLSKWDLGLDDVNSLHTRTPMSTAKVQGQRKRPTRGSTGAGPPLVTSQYPTKTMGANKIFVANVVIAQRRTHTKSILNLVFNERAPRENRFVVLRLLRFISLHWPARRVQRCAIHGCANLERFGA